MKEVAPGQRYGRWLVMEGCQKTPKGERKWQCRCDCGTERYVLERSLRHGGSTSCGCLRKEAAEQAVAYDLTGKTFGELTILGRSKQQSKTSGIQWHCRCSCGNTCDYPATLLITGRRTHCTGEAHRKRYAFSDIAGRRFGRLVAQQPVEARSEKGSVIWRCKCDCGREVDVPYNSLVYANHQSCGCKKKEHDRILRTLQTHVDGTSLDMIRSQKIPKDNTTGYKGVYLIRGRYTAKLVFQKKAYYLGRYDSPEEAYEARMEAEEAIYQPTLEYHARWQKKADRDPQWAAENPIRISVMKDQERLRVSFTPEL